MKNKLIFSTIVFISILIIIVFFSKEKINFKNNQNNIILYVGKGCPHCDLVEKFIKESNILIETKDIYQSKKNLEDLRNKAFQCGLLKSHLGIPFLWFKGECLMGDQEIISFFQKFQEKK